MSSAKRSPAPLPTYLLAVDDTDAQSLTLIIRQSRAGVMRATISTPQWHEIAEGWDGPHEMHVAIPLVNSYAEAFGYRAVHIDIESSQLWDPAWGQLER